MDQVDLEGYRNELDRNAAIQAAIVEVAIGGIRNLDTPTLEHPVGVLAVASAVEKLLQLGGRPRDVLTTTMLRTIVVEVTTNPYLLPEDAGRSRVVYDKNVQKLYEQGYARMRRRKIRGGDKKTKVMEVTPEGQAWLQTRQTRQARQL